MRRSVFFRRVLSLLLIALLLWAALTALFYAFISRPVFTEIKANELRPKAEVIADMLSQSFLEGNQQVDSLLQSSYELFDAWAFVVDGLSGELINASLPDSETTSLESIVALINQNSDALLGGKFTSLWLTANIKRASGPSEVLLIGVPVKLRFGPQDKVIGAVFFVKPMDEMNAGLSSMNIALLLSSFIVLLLMIFPAYLATARLIRPLRQIRDVALSMADGNFDVTANTRQRGEIGDLATTMNDLAGKLAASISDLTLERNRLRQILEGMNEGLLAVDRAASVTKTNNALSRLMTGEASDSPAFDLGAAENVSILAAYQAAMAENCEKQLTLQRGSRIISAQIAPLCEPDETYDSEGTVVGAVGLFRDITEAERLEQTRRDYVANVSHELRTPLTAIRALVEPLRDGLVNSETDRMRYYGIMLQEIIRLSHLINDMLELSRLQSGTLQMPQTDFNIDQLFLEFADRMGSQINDAGLSLHLPEQPSGCPLAYGNPDRVEQILIILVDNAVKFTPSGGIIRLGLEWNQQQILVSVTDSGTGIAPEDIEHIFERFYKADKAHRLPGTGLGLAIASEILQQMNQVIRVSSTPGQGSVFTFTLNRAKAI